MKDMLEYHVTLLKLQGLKDVFEREWHGKMKVEYHVYHPILTASSGFDYVVNAPRSIKKVRLIRVRAFSASDSYCHSPIVTLELFYGGSHLLDDRAPVGRAGYTTDEALEAFLDKLIALAPDRDGENKIGQALAALR